MQYQPEEKVLCFHGPLMYQAKILMAEDWKGTENQHGAVGPHYFVHYQGWKKTWDEWVPDARLLKYTDENLARQKALVDAHKAEAAAAAAVAAAHAENAASRSKTDARHKGGSAAGPGTASGRRGAERVPPLAAAFFCSRPHDERGGRRGPRARARTARCLVAGAAPQTHARGRRR